MTTKGGNALTVLAAHRKALVAAGVALATGMATATADGSLTQAEVWVVIGGTIAALGGVSRTRNRRA